LLFSANLPLAFYAEDRFPIRRWMRRLLLSYFKNATLLFPPAVGAA
jgi:hypothetical protein